LGYDKRTTANDYGKGIIFFLDRHAVSCNSGEALVGFHLYRPNENMISIEYDCQKTSALITSLYYTAQTPLNGVQSGYWEYSAQFLDRHTIACRSDYVLTGFKFVRSCRECDQFYYEYTCVAIKAVSCVEDVYTEWMDSNFGTIAYLDRHYVNAPAGALLTKFKVEALNFYRGFGYWDGVNLRYKYSYCYYRDVDSEKSKYSNNKHSRPTRVVLEYKEDGAGRVSQQSENLNLKKTESFEFNKSIE